MHSFVTTAALVLSAATIAAAGNGYKNPSTSRGSSNTHSQRIAAKLPAGMFSALGNQLVDENRNPVRLSCVYWVGMNAKDRNMDNQDAPIHGIQANMEAIAATGFNCIRIDINNVSLHDSHTPEFLANLDHAVAAASRDNVRVIIDDHDDEGKPGTGGCTAQQVNGLWYDAGGATNGTDGCNNPGHTTQESYKDDWVSIASRYAHNNTVIGYDLWNEPIAGHSLWGGGSDRDIHRMYETVGSAMLAKDASKDIFAECPLAVYDPRTLFDGVTVSSAPWGDCTGARKLPVVFTVNGKKITNKVIYDVHLYANAIDDYDRIFGSSASPSAIKAMNKSFGFLESENIAPVWDGESGTGFQQDPDDENWANMLVKYLNGDLGSQGGPTFHGKQQGMGIAWMSWTTQFTGPHDDDLGILNHDGTTVEKELKIVQQLFYYPKRSVAAK